MYVILATNYRQWSHTVIRKGCLETTRTSENRTCSVLY